MFVIGNKKNGLFLNRDSRWVTIEKARIFKRRSDLMYFFYRAGGGVVGQSFFTRNSLQCWIPARDAQGKELDFDVYGELPASDIEVLTVEYKLGRSVPRGKDGKFLFQ